MLSANAIRERLKRNVVTYIAYRCRDIGYGVEEGSIEAYWTGEIDTWGKYTIVPVDGSPTLYLFSDEFLVVEDL